MMKTTKSLVNCIEALESADENDMDLLLWGSHTGGPGSRLDGLLASDFFKPHLFAGFEKKVDDNWSTSISCYRKANREDLRILSMTEKEYGGRMDYLSNVKRRIRYANTLPNHKYEVSYKYKIDTDEWPWRESHSENHSYCFLPGNSCYLDIALLFGKKLEKFVSMMMEWYQQDATSAEPDIRAAGGEGLRQFLEDFSFKM